MLHDLASATDKPKIPFARQPCRAASSPSAHRVGTLHLPNISINRITDVGLDAASPNYRAAIDCQLTLFEMKQKKLLGIPRC